MSQRKTRTASPLQPPRERGTGRAFLLAALMHVLLVALFYHGVNWQNSTPAGAEAELWTEVPDSPASGRVPPARAAPAPPPVQDDNADIALQQKRRQHQEAAARKGKRAAQLAAQQFVQQQAAEKQKQADKLRQQQLAEQKKLEQQRKQEQTQAAAQKKAAAEKAEAGAKAKIDATAKAKATTAANAKLDKERKAHLAQLQSAAGGQGGSDGLAKSSTGSGDNAGLPGYADKVKRRVKPFIVWNGATEGLVTRVQVHCSRTGGVLGVSVVKPSGNPAWDQTVVGAVRAASPLPPDIDGSAPPNIAITFWAAE